MIQSFQYSWTRSLEVIYHSVQAVLDLDTSFEASYHPTVVSNFINHNTTEGYHNEKLEKYPGLSVSTSRQESQGGSPLAVDELICVILNYRKLTKLSRFERANLFIGSTSSNRFRTRIAGAFLRFFS